MKIEVIANKSDSMKDKGDLLETIAKKLLTVQGYKVTEQVRLTGAELDLLCEHKVNGRTIYVECKAHRDKIDANVLKNLAGTLVFKNLLEGWLITTSEFKKDAKGLQQEWASRPISQSQTLSFYTPDKVLGALRDAGVVSEPPNALLQQFVADEKCRGEWVLLISKYGYFWAVTVLKSGIPAEVILFHAEDGTIVTDPSTIENIALTDTSLYELEFRRITKESPSQSVDEPRIIEVVELQHSDRWDDYRPARSEDFVGRRKTIDGILSLFAAIRNDDTSTRVFALTGNSGMGKSSLLNKLRDKSTNKRHKHRLFVYAVDMRAATSSEYVYSSLLACLRKAQKSGFGDTSISLRITDFANPLESPEIKQFLASLAQKDQVVCLVFDQFEELSAKPDMLAVFDKAKALFLGANALRSNFCMGFAWKSDITVSGDNPAYYMWHELEDLRVTYVLKPFTDGESIAALNIFEKVIGERLHGDLRHNLLVISQGYPWLLKKLCIHLYAKIEQGQNQEVLIENKLDAGKLFDDDLQKLTSTEKACLEHIATLAPVDLGEVVEKYSEQIISNLINKRLVTKSGDRLSIYWDIFREYLLTKKVPEIPLHYLPTNEFNSVFSIGRFLRSNVPISTGDLSNDAGLSEKTVVNICSDLVMFEIAVREKGNLVLRPDVVEGDEESFLVKARQKLSRHAFTLALHKKYQGADLLVDEAIDELKGVYQNESFAQKTWRAYTLRLCRWLEVTGLIVARGRGWIVRDLNRVDAHVARRRRSGDRAPRRQVFTAPAPPEGTIRALERLLSEGRVAKSSATAREFRNAISVLKRFGLIFGLVDDIVPDAIKISRMGGPTNAIRKAAAGLGTLSEAIEIIETNPSISPLELGTYFDQEYSLNWTVSSKMRNGNGIRRWARWLRSQSKLE